MTQKTIDISEGVYKKITDLKQKEESISNFILRKSKWRYWELYKGAYLSAKIKENITKIEHFLKKVEVLNLDVTIMKIYAKILEKCALRCF